MGALRLLVALVAALRCLRLAIPCRHPTVRSCASSDALPHRPGLWCAGVPPALPSWRQRDLPGSWATRSTFALLSDPGRAGVPSRFGTPVLSPLYRRRRPQQEVSFRGSITRLLRSLSTLRRRRPRPAQDSLPAAGYALPGGIGYPQGGYEKFLMPISHLPPFPGLAWRDDSLYSKQPFVEKLTGGRFSFLLVAKPGDHINLYKDVAGLRRGNLPIPSTAANAASTSGSPVCR